MSRTSAPTATSKPSRWRLWAAFLAAWWIVAACTPVRPVVKVGLIASFEGLYRRTGYAALAAVRAAITDCSPPGVDVLPLALDDSAQLERATRAAAKLRADPAVAAVVGPLSPATAAAAAAQLQPLGTRWVVPFAVDPAGGFANPSQSQTWFAPLLQAVATAAKEQGSRRLLVAGDGPVTLDQTAIPVHFVGDDDPQSVLAQITAGDALFWTGDAADGAELLTLLRSRFPGIPFWTGPQGGDPVLAERAGQTSDAYWAIWTDVEYNAWARTHAPATPAAYLVYRATCSALAGKNGVSVASVVPWQVAYYIISPDPASQPYHPTP